MVKQLPDRMTQKALAVYLQSILKKHDENARYFLERRFELVRNDGRVPSNELQYRGLFREDRPDLEAVMKHPRLVIIGDPGSGKSAVVIQVEKRSTQGAAAEPVPLLLSLRGYAGDLKALIEQETNAPREVLSSDHIRRLYLLDGFDEVPPEHLNTFAADIDTLTQDEPHSRIVVTARQAFFVERRDLIPEGFLAYQLLDFDDKDIRHDKSERWQIGCDDLPARSVVSVTHHASLSQRNPTQQTNRNRCNR